VASRPRWPAIAYCLLSWAGAFYHLILFAFLKRDVQRSLSLSDTTIGWIDGATFAAAALGGFLLGRAADLGARRLVVALTPALPALGSWLTASADGAPLVILGRLAVGFGVGGGWGVGHAIIADLYEGRKRLRAAAILQTGGPIGVMCAAVAGCMLIPGAAEGWRSVLAWSAWTAAFAILDPWGMRGVPPRAAAPDFAEPAREGPHAAAVRASVSRLFVLLVLQMTAYWCTFAWLPSHLIGLGAARSTVGWMQLATGATQALADLGFGGLSPRVGVRRLFAACNLAFGLGVVALAIAFTTIAAHPVVLTVTIAAVGLGSGSWAAFGPLYAEHVPSRIRGRISSFSYHLARSSQLLVQPAVATLGAPAALLVAALAAWAGAGLIQRLPRRG
jgi:MFS family permease